MAHVLDSLALSKHGQSLVRNQLKFLTVVNQRPKEVPQFQAPDMVLSLIGFDDLVGLAKHEASLQVVCKVMEMHGVAKLLRQDQMVKAIAVLRLFIDKPCLRRALESQQV